jgi:hypothetical protein
MTTRARPAVALGAPEKTFQSQVEDVLRLTGWVWLHVFPLRPRKGAWQTPISGPLAKGWPDLTVVRKGVCGVIEVKTATGVLRPDQQHALTELREHVDFCWVVRPADLQRVASWLQHPNVAPSWYGVEQS